MKTILRLPVFLRSSEIARSVQNFISNFHLHPQILSNYSSNSPVWRNTYWNSSKFWRLEIIKNGTNLGKRGKTNISIQLEDNGKDFGNYSSYEYVGEKSLCVCTWVVVCVCVCFSVSVYVGGSMSVFLCVFLPGIWTEILLFERGRK